MNLFSKIPDNFFSILSSRNKNVYGMALVTLYDSLIMYHNRIKKNDYLELLKSRSENDVNDFEIDSDEFDDDALIYEPTLQAKASLILRRLIDTGWVMVDTDINTGVDYLLLPAYSISMLKIIYEFVSDNESRYTSFVHSTYADLQLEDDAQDEFMYRSLVSAYNKTKDLELEVSKLNHSIRVFHKQLANIFSPNEVLKQHFDVAREDVVDPVYHPLKTNDSIVLYSKPISLILKRWLITETVREKLINQALNYNHQLKDKQEAFDDILKRINYIQDTYDYLAGEMEEIDKAQSKYTQATTEKVIYLNNSDKSIKGKLETIFLALAKIVNREEGSEAYKSILADVNNAISLYQQGYIDTDSLTRPIKRTERSDSEPLMLDDFDHNADEGLMQSLLYQMDQYSDEKIEEFMDRAFAGRDDIHVHDINVKDVEDFIMVILGSVKGNDDSRVFYKLKRGENVDRTIAKDKFDMPDYEYVRKGE
jgi:hypothetical protein